MPDPAPQELAQDKVVEIMRGGRFCMLTSVGVSDQGRLHSHPMTPQEVTEEGDVWFFVDGTSEQAANVTAEKRVNLAFADGSTWLSVSGHASLLRDQAKIDQLWNPVLEAWFPEGKDAESVQLLHVEADSAEYWDSPGGRIASALAFAKSKVTGEKPDVGGNASVDL